jgi:hypothetical protein
MEALDMKNAKPLLFSPRRQTEVTFSQHDFEVVVIFYGRLSFKKNSWGRAPARVVGFGV